MHTAADVQTLLSLLIIYGSEGIGKSTFASAFPDPLFIDTEGGTAHMDVSRIDGIQSWEELLSVVREVAAEPDVCKTLVIDTVDWAEQLCVKYICEKYKQNSLEGFGYGRGYTYLSEEFTRLLSALDGVIASGKHVVITAHAKMRKFEQPDEQGAYDRWEMKLSKQVAPLVKEWCNMLLFLNYKTYVVTTESKTAFYRAVTILMKDKEDIIADMLLLKQSLTDTTGLDEKEQMISEEMTLVAGLIEKHVKKNAVVAQNQEEYMARYNELVDRYEGLQKQLNAVNVERTGRMTKSHAIDEYVRELSSAEAFSMSFNGKRWNAMVDRVNVYKDGRLVFRFAGGQEITVNIWD